MLRVNTLPRWLEKNFCFNKRPKIAISQRIEAFLPHLDVRKHLPECCKIKNNNGDTRNRTAIETENVTTTSRA